MLEIIHKIFILLESLRQPFTLNFVRYVGTGFLHTKGSGHVATLKQYSINTLNESFNLHFK